MRWFLDSITIDLITEIPSTLTEHFLVFDIIHGSALSRTDVEALSDKLSNVQQNVCMNYKAKLGVKISA